MKPPRCFCITLQASRRLKVDLILLGQLIIQRDPGQSRIAKKEYVSPNNREVSQEKIGPAAHVKAMVFTGRWAILHLKHQTMYLGSCLGLSEHQNHHHFLWVGNSRETSFVRLQHISPHISLSALQGIPPWSLTVCPWKFMVGRLYLSIGKVTFQGLY